MNPFENPEQKGQYESSRTECCGGGAAGDSAGSAGCNNAISRRDLLRLAGAGSVALLMDQKNHGRAMAGPFEVSDFGTPAPAEAPADKKLSAAWLRSLRARGKRRVHRGSELEKIGMPIGGLCTGQLYLGGDGRLWHWDIFNQHIATGDAHYANPPVPHSPIEQGFALQITGGGTAQTRALGRSGFSDISFSGEYPIGTVEYKDAGSPVAVSLEAFSPFIPLATDDSSLPATVLRFTVKNTSKTSVEVVLTGWLQNAVSLYNSWPVGARRNRIVRGDGMSFLQCSAEKPTASSQAAQPDIAFEEWNRDTYQGWTAEGAAFGTGPVLRKDIPQYQGDVGGAGERVVNSHASAPGADVGAKDAQTGKLTSRRFLVERNFIHFWIGGGAHAGKTALNLVTGGQVRRSATGANSNRMALHTFDVRDFKGQEAFIEIVDAETGAWGNIGVGSITFSDQPPVTGPLEEMPDWGTMGLALLGAPPEHAEAASEKGGFDGRQNNDANAPADQLLIGAIGRKLRLRAGQSATVSFVLAWHFPNLEIGGLGKVGRHYVTRFDSARAVAQYVATNFERLSTQTRLWRDTWLDSTLPHWFLDRTFLNTSILATSTCYRFANGRFYGWEGVGCCAGTCTHVWHYAQAPARLFPDLERTAREMADYGAGFDAATGRIRFRAEHNDHWAVDGQAGCILRVWREHQMSSDARFLRRLWPRVKKSLEFLIARDSGLNGIMDGAQHNTLDADWFGQVAWLSSLYVAALRAGSAMAREMGDTAFASRAQAIAEAGGKNIAATLFNGEYFVQLADRAHPKTVGSYDGCEIDQVFGQSWAHQVGLGRVLPEAPVKKALAALWKYNFTPDVGPFRAAHKPGRWYAMPGEGGLLMCSWPRGEAARVGEAFDYYFNECMTGFEYQVAAHMMWEGMTTESLAITRTIHDRYDAARRNPWNEVECGDHYARAMASYGVFLAACGYEYNGPKGHLGFAPRLTPQNFKAAFTAAEGWGSFAQQSAGGRMKAEVAVKWGRLRLKILALALPQTPPRASGRTSGQAPQKTVKVTRNGRAVAAQSTTEGSRLLITLATETVLRAGQKLEVAVR